MTDSFDAALRDLHPARVIYCRREFDNHEIAHPPYQASMRLHFVAQGACWLIVADGSPRHLHSGDLVLIPNGLRLRDQAQAGDASSRWQADATDQPAIVFSFAVEFDALIAPSLIEAMPALMLIRGTPSRDQALVATLDQMSTEAGSSRIGNAAMLLRLADVGIVAALRLWIEDNPYSPAIWLAAMRVPQIGRALAAMHQHPGDHWTVDALARVAGLSRSTFTERFLPLLGMSPARYVAQWRMQLGAKLLREKCTIADIAAQLGYESDASFSRTFKRIMGEPPSATRLKAKQQDAPVQVVPRR
ncbi:AraC family transcriptional regulator [Dyella silvatica]|uniref:AraC family transcriptional regulator n=1 Tax=Dyella silvatica TaxID=2992128 RepID=UPI002254124F|nr:AraC family transcriptional regulator [Dyella silvatica]